jgi:hypothetical protein
MKTLIITVGTRQIGWRCQDGIIRCFGTDGFRSEPPHTEELFQELGIERKNHQENELTYSWGVFELGRLYYEYCNNSLNGDFNQVELLIDHQIIQEQISQGLNHIMLWATKQPETVSWQYRRLDTVWLAELMAAKIKQQFPQIEVDIFDPIVDLKNQDAIRQELEGYILKYILFKINIDSDDDFSLMIENKGASPSIAEKLVIYAAGLVRQFPVSIITPEEPEPFYELTEDGKKSSRFSEQYQITSLENYFLPLEKVRIISAWERGDFNEAQIWLEAHQERYEVLYKLARWLTLAVNGETSQFISQINNWLNSNLVKNTCSASQINHWQNKIKEIKDDPYVKIWEDTFLIKSALIRGNYTNAFVLFCQTLESFLSLRCEHLQLDYPDLRTLIDQWINMSKAQGKWRQLLDDIRQKRNRVIHDKESVNVQQFEHLWLRHNFPVSTTDNVEKLMNLMINTLQKVCSSQYQPPADTLLSSLSEWGLSLLQS